MLEALKRNCVNLLKQMGKVLILCCWEPFIDFSQKGSAAAKAAQHSLMMQYRNMLSSKENLPSIWDVGFRVFSQNDEDGILLYIFSLLGTTNRLFVEIGTQDGRECNCANLAINFGWHGLFADADHTAVTAGKKFYSWYNRDTGLYPPKFICSMVSPENVNPLIRDAGFEGDIDLLSIDIDGNDYWVWEAIDVISPRVVVIETHVEFGLNDIVIPYKANPDKEYHGASPVAMQRIAAKKGYRLIGANRFGFNTFYVKTDLGKEILPTIPVEEVIQHHRNREVAYSLDQIRSLPHLSSK